MNEQPTTATATATPVFRPPLPETLPAASPERDARVAALAAQVAEADSDAIIAFGVSSQAEVTKVADEMLDGVRNKDAGAAAGPLNEMVAILRGFDAGEAGEERSLLDRLLGRAKPVVKVLQRYETVQKQIEDTTITLDRHKDKLRRDIANLDRLYDGTLVSFHSLADHIEAGEKALSYLDSVTIPEREKAAAGGDMLAAQALRDLRSRRDELERRVHDLKLTRQVTMQALPAIRVVQENDKALVSKITSTLVNTVPLWKQQLTLAVTIARAREAGGDLKAATDLTNELLTANADALRQSNAEIREQVERGVFDIEAVKRANDQLVGTIEDTLRIADAARVKRREAEATLVTLEGELKQSLSSARARVSPPASPAPTR
ncbi:toxic anion resistance protein [Elioraea rosea]|uniref:toxic anion resistance protein n=1 Tax=Elioraea rosea TaxID=2492390 RepID=UPI0011866AE6|nr:toxic anion resistance protein [Elioraea rosea]